MDDDIETRQLGPRRRAPLDPPREPFGRHAHERQAGAADLAVGHDAVDAHACPARDRFEVHLDDDVIDRALPAHTGAGLPHRHPAQLERVVLVHLEQPSADAGLQAAPDAARRVPRVDGTVAPPLVDLVGEGGERRHGVDVDVDGRGDVHRFFASTCRLNERSWVFHSAWS